MKLKQFFSKKLHIQIITYTFLLSLAVLYPKQASATCYSIAGCPTCHCDLSGGEVACLDGSIPYCCTESTTECQGSTFGDPGTFFCSCNKNTDGTWNCGPLGSDSCNSGNKPDGYTCGSPVYTNPCGDPNSTYTSCNLECVPGNLPGEGDPCDNGVCEPPLVCDVNGNCITPPSSSATPLNRPNPQGDCETGEIDSALGCIPVERDAFTIGFFKFLVGIGGGLALIVMLIGSVIFMTGGSNPEQVKKGKEIFLGALAGLLFIIFATILLQTVAGGIIGLPQFI